MPPDRRGTLLIELGGNPLKFIRETRGHGSLAGSDHDVGVLLAGG